MVGELKTCSRVIMNADAKDLIVDKIYTGSRLGNASDDPLPALLGVSRGGGFRYIGNRTALEDLLLVVLKSNFNDPDWPDHLDRETGIFTYYGDNKKPGKQLHDTPRGGNRILTHLFAGRHDPDVNTHFPPILLFGRAGEYRDVRFLGLAVPGAQSLGPDEDAVAIWRTGNQNERFQNYKAIFTMLDVPLVSRDWLADVKNKNAADSKHVPRPWIEWLKFRKYHPLVSPNSLETRTKKQQIPDNSEDNTVLKSIYNKYKNDPHGFEACALEIANLMMPDICKADLTRPWRDGGRDAIGEYRIGKGASSIQVDFALEAKCYDPSGKGVGVKELSRLISRLRHRQFGILVTTSYLASQAYSELKEDGHPVVILCGSDITTLLKTKIGSRIQIEKWLNSLTYRSAD
ncbi:restriction endonuclease [Desulfosarcina ovata subsp. sediminis]|uniref:Restriction endonuclease n=1 Tax=Desulfosarcina ovata subsp. sediminis TaxID=885957 RepID=A0A5K7ZGG2_9BACT|nr:restriction endonuclease [Desulfosarcina ovata subsp. sediminis]